MVVNRGRIVPVDSEIDNYDDTEKSNQTAVSEEAAGLAQDMINRVAVT